MNTQTNPEYRAYHRAKGRCNNPRNLKFPSYGGRGIKFLFASFEQFYQEVGPRPSSSVLLDRIDNEGNYEPGNVRWATPSESNVNRRRTPALLSHMRRAGGTAAHVRWHVRRGVVNPGCAQCR